MSPYAACKSTDALCDACVGEGFAQLRGTAQRRGEAWGEALARVLDVDRAWPRPATPRMKAIAARRIADLTDDERLRELLVDEVLVGAGRYWDRIFEQVG